MVFSGMFVCMYVCTRSGVCYLGLFRDLNRGPTTLRATKLPAYGLVQYELARRSFVLLN